MTQSADLPQCLVYIFILAFVYLVKFNCRQFFLLLPTLIFLLSGKLLIFFLYFFLSSVWRKRNRNMKRTNFHILLNLDFHSFFYVLSSRRLSVKQPLIIIGCLASESESQRESRYCSDSVVNTRNSHLDFQEAHFKFIRQRNSPSLRRKRRSANNKINNSSHLGVSGTQSTVGEFVIKTQPHPLLAQFLLAFFRISLEFSDLRKRRLKVE